MMAKKDTAVRNSRQAAPEFANVIYQNALFQERAIGDYISICDNSVRVTEEVRLYMVTVITEVHRIKSYREETLFLACSLADRYLAKLTQLR